MLNSNKETLKAKIVRLRRNGVETQEIVEPISTCEIIISLFLHNPNKLYEHL